MSRDAQNTSKQRMNLELPTATIDTIKECVSLTSAASPTEAIRRGMDVYRLLLSARADGQRVFIQRPDGTSIELMFV